MWIWLITLLKGFLPVDGKRVGKIIWVLVLCACAIGIYHKVFVQKTTKIEKIEHYYACPQEDKIVGLRFNLWKFSIKLGL
jgi:hypothetical protein